MRLPIGSSSAALCHRAHQVAKGRRSRLLLGVGLLGLGRWTIRASHRRRCAGLPACGNHKCLAVLRARVVASAWSRNPLASSCSAATAASTCGSGCRAFQRQERAVGGGHHEQRIDVGPDRRKRIHPRNQRTASTAMARRLSGGGFSETLHQVVLRNAVTHARANMSTTALLRWTPLRDGTLESPR